MIENSKDVSLVEIQYIKYIFKKLRGKQWGKYVMNIKRFVILICKSAYQTIRKKLMAQ